MALWWMFLLFACILNHVLSQTTDGPSNCLTLYITIERFDSSTADPNDWNGIYSIDETTSYGAPIWNDGDKWLRYIETHWLLNSVNSELLIYNTTDLFPPTNGYTIWSYEYNNEKANISLFCSDSLSPTTMPTDEPSNAPV